MDYTNKTITELNARLDEIISKSGGLFGKDTRTSDEKIEAKKIVDELEGRKPVDMSLELEENCNYAPIVIQEYLQKVANLKLQGRKVTITDDGDSISVKTGNSEFTVSGRSTKNKDASMALGVVREVNKKMKW